MAVRNTQIMIIERYHLSRKAGGNYISLGYGDGCWLADWLVTGTKDGDHINRSSDIMEMIFNRLSYIPASTSSLLTFYLSSSNSQQNQPMISHPTAYIQLLQRGSW